MESIMGEVRVYISLCRDICIAKWARPSPSNGMMYAYNLSMTVSVEEDLCSPPKM